MSVLNAANQKYYKAKVS